MKAWWSLCTLLFLVPAQGYRILSVLPFPSKSHHRVFQPLLRELAIRGHSITSFTPIPMDDPPANYTEIIVPSVLPDIYELVSKVNYSSLSTWETIKFAGRLSPVIAAKLFTFGPMLDLLSSDQQFDAVVTSAGLMQEPVVGLQHKFDAVGIQLLPLGRIMSVDELVGNPVNPAYTPDYTVPYSDRMTFFERLHNTYIYVLSTFYYKVIYLPQCQILLDRYVKYPGSESRPPILELLTNQAMTLSNSHFSISFASSSTPNAVDVGGLNIQPSKPLPKDLEEFMSGAEHGVVYFSLGSTVKAVDTLQGESLDALITAFGKLKQKVLWKWENDVLPNIPSNVKISKWLPQQPILAHKNCRLFITQGGILSVSEATHYGVPMIGIPVMGDQSKNVKSFVRLGYGVELDITNLTEPSISSTIDEVLNNPRYREAAKLRSQLFRDRMATPMDTAVYWVEYVNRYRGAPHLRPAAATLPLYQRLLLDIIGFVLLLLALVTYTFFFLLSLVCRWFRTSKKGYSEKKNK